ncbi:hypothetical protein BU24DRAFT_491282 [Aaosphaeria arxii CBS 175.79]|uniref:Uncharacterized protein n=1 Tax=Aaosphaeria arxii CBS 175.79 TaxID=1450172 RepID=A0A6A5XYA9_9PLEO|nr:uncharacterized protein BU24DRAFT_491282 [Aaosphaeria arxii CBS 175.79]KAF2018298.1 hypothetical protein BU24DRAFT_491282 [Aaosphaeria arxii CBS 175.79]
MIVNSLDPKSDSPIKSPSPRRPKLDITSPTFEDVYQLSLRRVMNIVITDQDDPPYLLFPTAEHTQVQFFTESDWKEFGNMELEASRLRFTLTRYPERGPPLACETTLKLLLSETSILKKWLEIVGDIQNESKQAMMEAHNAMLSQHSDEREPNTKESFVTVPVGYVTNDKSVDLQLQLWERALAEIAEALTSSEVQNIDQFLQIYSFLKDSIGGLNVSFQPRIALFQRLIQDVHNTIPDKILSTETWKLVAAQCAAESSFLAIEKLKKVSYIHFTNHQVLPYVYVSLRKLPRAEFSVPKRVLEIAMEMVSNSTPERLCDIAPITIAYVAPLKHEGKMFKVVIDGNNRVTAILLLQFLAASSSLDSFDVGALQQFCDDLGLGMKWFLDMKDVAEELFSRSEYLESFRSHVPVLRSFAQVSRVAALVVQEQEFHTICMSRTTGSRLILLQPMHQALYNDKTLPFGWAAQHGQAHGRSMGFKPLLPRR